MTIYTAAYWDKRVKDGVAKDTLVPVGITLYGLRDKWKYGYRLATRLTSMAPNHQLFKIDDYKAFRQPFLELLEIRWPLIQTELAQLKKSYGDRAIVLLCFDRVDRYGDWCHRQIVAEFLANKLGEPVLELSDTSSDLYVPTQSRMFESTARSSVDRATGF
jgi:hypothetical protein